MEWDQEVVLFQAQQYVLDLGRGFRTNSLRDFKLGKSRANSLSRQRRRAHPQGGYDSPSRRAAELRWVKASLFQCLQRPHAL